MNDLELIRTNDEVYADSRDVAQMIEMEHSKLLRTIRTYCEYLNEAKIGLVEFFVESEYEDAKGEIRPRYLITRKGCDMIANKLTGKKGVLFTAKYVTAFEKMKQLLNEQANLSFYSTKASSLGEITSAAKFSCDIMRKQGHSANEVAKQAKLIFKHFGIPVVDNFVRENPYEQIVFEKNEHHVSE